MAIEQTVAWLETYYATVPQDQPVKRDQVTKIRGQLRQEFPGYNSTFKTIRAALESKPEWSDWLEELFGERSERLEMRKAAKAERSREAAAGDVSEKLERAAGHKLARSNKHLHIADEPLVSWMVMFGMARS